MAGFSKTLLLSFSSLLQSITPDRTRSGLGSFPFARRYSENRCFFLFLRVLRCFSSPGSLPYVMYWRMDDWGLLSRVSPFRNLRITEYLLLPAAYRSLSRLSSALSAKASTLRPYQLDLIKNFVLVRCIALHLFFLCLSINSSELFGLDVWQIISLWFILLYAVFKVPYAGQFLNSTSSR